MKIMHFGFSWPPGFQHKFVVTFSLQIFTGCFLRLVLFPFQVRQVILTQHQRYSLQFPVSSIAVKKIQGSHQPPLFSAQLRRTMRTESALQTTGDGATKTLSKNEGTAHRKVHYFSDKRSRKCRSWIERIVLFNSSSQKIKVLEINSTRAWKV